MRLGLGMGLGIRVGSYRSGGLESLISNIYVSDLFLNRIDIVFNEPMNSSIPDITSFTSGIKTLINCSLNLSGYVLSIYTNSEYIINEVDSITYTKPLLNPLKTVSGDIEVPDFTKQISFIISSNNYNVITPYTDLISFGDSISNVSYSYNADLSESLGGILSNLSIGSSGIAEMIRRSNLYIGVNTKQVICAMDGFNDVMIFGQSTEKDNKFDGVFRAFLINAFAKTFVKAVNGNGVTTSGVLSTLNAKTSYCGRFDSTGISNSVGNYWEFVFTGTNVSIAFLGASASYAGTFGTARIEVDGNLIEDVWLDNKSDGNGLLSYNDQVVPFGYSIFGLANTSHTLRVTNIAGSHTTGSVCVDYFAILNDPIDTQLVMIGSIPHVNQAGYDSKLPVVVNDSTLDYYSNIIKSVCDDFKYEGYNIEFVEVNDYYDVNTGISGDNIHPTALGHVQIYNAFENQLRKNILSITCTPNNPHVYLTYSEDIDTLSNKVYSFNVSGHTINSVSIKSDDSKVIDILLNENTVSNEVVIVGYRGNITDINGNILKSFLSRYAFSSSVVDVIFAGTSGMFTKNGTQYTALKDAWLSYDISTSPMIGDGRFISDNIDISNASSLGMGVKTANSNGVLGTWDCCLWSSNGIYYTRNYGGGNIPWGPCSPFDKVCINRVGTTITAEVYRSGTWTVIFTYSLSVSSPLYMLIGSGVVNSIIYNPKVTT